MENRDITKQPTYEIAPTAYWVCPEDQGIFAGTNSGRKYKSCDEKRR